MRIGESLYHFKRTSLDGAEITAYSNAKKYRTKLGDIVCQPMAQNSLDTAVYGTDISEQWNITCNYSKYHRAFSVGDLLIIDETPAVISIDYANAIITGIKNQNRLVVITAKRIDGK